MGKCRAQIPSMGHHTWPYVTSLPSLINSVSGTDCNSGSVYKDVNERTKDSDQEVRETNRLNNLKQ